jgi:hypothetical protein
MKKIIGYAILGAIVLFILIQFIPYGRNHTNPPVVAQPTWPSEEVHQVVQQSCYDCHSNETVWPWYSNIAPISWMVYHDVEEGRSRLNFSEWNSNRAGRRLREVSEVLQEGEMPMPIYVLMHPTAKLSDTERQMLIESLPVTASMK